MADIKDPENTIILTLKDGEVVIELLKDVAPKHTERMKQLARDKAYDENYQRYRTTYFHLDASGAEGLLDAWVEHGDIGVEKFAEEEGRPETATPSPALATAGTQAAGGASMAGRG